MDNPTWGYRRAEDGEVEAQIFDGDLPKGWFDSPAAIPEPKKPAARASKE